MQRYRTPQISHTVSTLALALAIAVTSTPFRAAAQVIPAGNAAVEGTNFATNLFRNDEETLQFRWSSGLLGAIAPGTIINGISFRLDAAQGTPFPASSIGWSQFNMLMGTRTTTLSTSSLTANEVGAVSVRSGPLTIAANALGGGSIPNAFTYLIDFTTPFTYTGNDLFLSIRHSDGTTLFPGAAIDLAEISGDNSQFMYGNSFNSTDVNGYLGGPGFGFGAAAVVSLRTTTVPEPSALALVGIGLAAMVSVGRRQRRWHVDRASIVSTPRSASASPHRNARRRDGDSPQHRKAPPSCPGAWQLRTARPRALKLFTLKDSRTPR